MIADDDGLREFLRSLSPSARGHFRNVLIHDQADRDAISLQLLRHHDDRGHDWADIIDTLTMYPEAWRRVVRLLAEVAAEGGSSRFPEAR